jgi:retron-type reverse transcriptase
MRPLGMAAYEDKLVQSALGRILMAIYEPKFRNSMYGFRPNRDCHDALKDLAIQIERGKINYIVDADIKVITSNRLPAVVTTAFPSAAVTMRLANNFTGDNKIII